MVIFVVNMFIDGILLIIVENSCVEIRFYSEKDVGCEVKIEETNSECFGRVFNI